MEYFFNCEPNQVVLFFDLLGFSNLIKNHRKSADEIGKVRNNIVVNMDAFYRIMNDKFSDKNWQEAIGVKSIFISDSIVMSTSLDNVEKLLDELITIQNEFLCTNIAFRGAICVGELYHQSNVWGEALVRAVELEKDEPKHPGIIITKDDFDKLQVKNEYKKYFFQEGQFMVFEPIMPEVDIVLKNVQEGKTIGDINSTLQAYSKAIISNYNSTDDKGVREKWCWLAKNMISLIEKYKERIDQSISEYYCRERAERVPECQFNNADECIQRMQKILEED